MHLQRSVLHILFVLPQFSSFKYWVHKHCPCRTWGLLNRRSAISNTVANKWISKNTSLHLSSPRVLLFPNMSFPAELCFCRNVSLRKSYSWSELEQLHLLWKHPQGRVRLCKRHKVGSSLPGGLGLFQHMGRVPALPFPALASKPICKINQWHC